MRVVGNVAWTDTRLQVNRGEQLRFSATGEVELAPGTTASPAGKAGAFPKEVYPVTGAAPGALIGRVGNGQPVPDWRQDRHDRDARDGDAPARV